MSAPPKWFEDCSVNNNITKKQSKLTCDVNDTMDTSIKFEENPRLASFCDSGVNLTKIRLATCITSSSTPGVSRNAHKKEAPKHNNQPALSKNENVDNNEEIFFDEWKNLSIEKKLQKLESIQWTKDKTIQG